MELLKGIKAYFKPDDLTATGDNISGDILLFKADTVGGNITLTGNIINTDANGGAKIELMNGFGHINVVNNSVHNLVTSNLNADTETRGVLTINDFKVASAGNKPDYSNFDNLNQSDLTETFLANHAGTYTVKVGDDGVMITEVKNQTDGNGSFGSQKVTTTLANGAKSYSTTYTPGDDAFYVKKDSETITQRIYVKRSWIVELFCGKKYVESSYATAPEYGVAKNPIAVNFVGYDSPEINVKSKGDVILNSSISAIPGTIDIKSDGNIISNSMSNLISGRRIELDAGLDSNIGEYDSALKTVKPIQVAIYGNGGLLSAKGKDIYLNYPKTDISDIAIFSNNGSVYLGTDTGSLDMKGKHLMGITGANNLELGADRINLNPAELAEGGSSNIVAKNWIVRAKDDIYIENSGDIVAKYIVSENGGKVTLISDNGSILSGETGTYSTNNIHAGNIVLNALNGAIGASDKALKFANSAIYNVVAKDDIYLDSNSKMYVDRVTSNDGSVNLKSKFGIIASKITTDKSGKEFTYKYDDNTQSDIAVYSDETPVSDDDMRVYNISSKNDINLVTIAGNIENITVDTDGVINAIAGYN
ncbi:hypothetical protein II810_01015, partial [bacterium]|nr:hypothetical protein [bacterium]